MFEEVIGWIVKAEVATDGIVEHRTYMVGIADRAEAKLAAENAIPEGINFVVGPSIPASSAKGSPFSNMVDGKVTPMLIARLGQKPH